MQHIASPRTAMRRRRMNDLFYPPRTHRDDQLRSPKRPVATSDVDSETLLGSTAHRHRVSDVFHHPEPAHGPRALRETGTLLRTPQRRMSELFYHSPSLARDDSLQPDATKSREPAPDTKRQRRISELFYSPPTRIQSKREQCHEWPQSLTKSAPLPLRDSGLTTSGTQNSRHDGGQSRMRQAEQKDLTERLERLNSLSAVIECRLQEQKERKLQEQKEHKLQEQEARKTLRLLCSITSEAMHRDKMI